MKLFSNFFKKNIKVALLSYILTPLKKDSLSPQIFLKLILGQKYLDELATM
jgi:hypothetical protein